MVKLAELEQRVTVLENEVMELNEIAKEIEA